MTKRDREFIGGMLALLGTELIVVKAFGWDLLPLIGLWLIWSGAWFIRIAGYNES